MPKKHPNTVRWGGPGASHEDRTKPMPERAPPQPEGATSTNPRVSQVSGGGGERDEKHSHVDSMRSSKSHTTATASPTSSPDWRPNRSRRDRKAEVELQKAISEQRTFGAPPPQGAASPQAPDAGEGVPVRTRFQGDNPGGPVICEQAQHLIRRAIAQFERDLSEVDIYLADTAGHGSPGPKSCTVQAVPHRGQPVAVTASAGDMEKAVAAAAVELVHRLRERLGAGEPPPPRA